MKTSVYNTTITYYKDIIQVKFYDSINNNGGSGSSVPESHESIVYRSLSRTRKKVFDYARMNEFDYFVTLTFNPEKVDSFSYQDSATHMSDWLKNIRRVNPEMKYLGVPEFHKSGRYHFHFLMANIPNVSMTDSGHRTPAGQVIYNLDCYSLGWTTAIEVYEQGAKLSGYISKYISKDIMCHTKGRKRYWCSRNLVLPDYKVLYTCLDDLMKTYNFRGYELVYQKNFGEEGATILEYKVKE